MRKLLVLPVALAAAAVLVLQTPALAVQVGLVATLTGSQEVPPNASTASGTGVFLLDTEVPVLTYAITVFGLDFTGSQTPNNANDNLLNAHIHAPAPLGVNAGIVFGFIGTPFNDNNPNDVVVTPFATGVGGTVTGKWDALEGNNTTLAAQIPNILAGASYVNFHTVQFPGGEIRGQIVPEPGTLLLMGAGMIGVGALAWRRQRRASRS